MFLHLFLLAVFVVLLFTVPWAIWILLAVFVLADAGGGS